jgi:hypothetical protein
MIAIEYAWNVYPATPVSSGILHAAHMVLLGALLFTAMPAPSKARSVDKKYK